jgi:predicted RNase H-like HicB family nuclease
MHEFDVVLLEDKTGGYEALVPALPGCHTQGDTLTEVMDNIREAIDLYIETLTEKENS